MTTDEKIPVITCDPDACREYMAIDVGPRALWPPRWEAIRQAWIKNGGGRVEMVIERRFAKPAFRMMTSEEIRALRGEEGA